MSWGRVLPLFLATLLTVALLTVSLFTGVYDIRGGERGWEMFAITRIPRTVALALVGASMAMCGLVMQLLTQNKFVEPTTTGTTEWAGLGLIAILVFFPQATLGQRMVGAILASLIGTLIFFAFLQRVSLRSSLVVPIVGIMLGAVVGALSTFVAMKTNMLQSLGIWFAGSFTGVVRGRYELLWLVVLLTIIVFIMADRFTVAGLGEDIASNVGLNYKRVLLLGIILVSMTTGITTVIVGSLPFLGLVVPNIVSLFRGDNLRSNLPWVCFGGIWMLISCDIISRTIISPFEVPVSLILAILGAVVFIYLLLRGRKNVA